MAAPLPAFALKIETRRLRLGGPVPDEISKLPEQN
jgi:hypothetical protein